ncbi:cyclic nucleotide-gated ion channel 1-like [Chenopodium quinoa]|uniref:cyclic nucleotide-gated ion channel 1-like n=1 Tax=Chenopodium quinoa TaxID=63459 RepID=UPI000B772D34|nr:cyclic nucleotide-gated ion channel 1-like [Chenopodium quinoa]XP_021760320.1 cyclic nucleotide-gated ion channel 1-like [Chenopodium quinoa]
MSGNLQLSELMSNNRDRVVRFEDHNSEGSTSSEQPFYPSQTPSPSLENGAGFGSAFDVIRRGFERSSHGIRTLTGNLSFQGIYYQSAKKPELQDTILDPQGPFLQKWNKIFLISCFFAMAWDPLFFYIPVIDGKKNCLNLDADLEIIACFLRTSTDLFYLLHIILQFRTGYVSPSSRVLGRGVLIKDYASIARRYLYSYFFVDILAVLPFPQMAVLVIIPKLMMSGGPLTSKGVLKLVIFAQYVPRFIRIYPLYKEVTHTSGIITETAWVGAAFNLFLYMLASHVTGAVWYLFAIDRQSKCWHKSCLGERCHNLSLYCKMQDTIVGAKNFEFNSTYCKPVNPNDISDGSVFNFGMYYDALQSEVVQSKPFLRKFFYCFWWGLRNLSSLGQNLSTSTFIGENLLAIFICIAGLVLFSFLIGNMQKYLQSTTVRVEEMRIRKRDAEQWMSHRMLPEDMRERVRKYEQYNWQETRGVDEESVIRNLPRDLRRDIKRHLCLASLMRVPMFAKLDEQLKDAMCDRLKPMLYTENSFIVREGDPVNEMLFIMRGSLLTMTTNGGRTGFFNSVSLKAGDFCGEELLTWALDPQSSSNLPISTRTVQTETEVEAFALMPDDLKFVASQFRRLHSKQLRHTFRFYSLQWKTWAACFIQAAWRRCYRRKLEKSLQEAEEYALAKEGGSSPSFSVTIYASRFAANALRNLRHNAPRNNRIPPRSPLLNLQKPTEPDFTSI